MAVDQFGHGFEGAVFVVYLSLLVNPRYPAAQYALFSGLAFLIPRLLAGLSGVFQKAIGYDGFFIMAGTMSVAVLVLLPFIVRAKPRPDDDPNETGAVAACPSRRRSRTLRAARRLWPASRAPRPGHRRSIRCLRPATSGAGTIRHGRDPFGRRGRRQGWASDSSVEV